MKTHARVERVHALRVAARVDGAAGREQPDPAVPRRLHGRVRLGRDHAHDRNRELALELRQRRRRRGVARDDDQLHVLLLEERADLLREAADLVERPRPVGQPRVVAEVDEVLLGERDETLVEDGQPADSGVEQAYGAGVHGRKCKRGYPVAVVRRRIVLLLSVLAALSCAGSALAAAPQELTIAAADGTPLSCALVEPDGTAPAAGWPAVMLFHGLGGKHQDMEPLATTFLAPAGYASLMCDARGHGTSGGLFGLDGPTDVADTQFLFNWLTARPEISDTQIGALGISLGGGAVWNAAVAGVPFKAIVPTITWTNLTTALAPQGLSKSGLVVLLAQRGA